MKSILIACLISLLATGLSWSAPCPTQKLKIGHINGILVERHEAIRNKERLELAYGSTHDGNQIEYFFAYNKSRGFWSDLREVANQKKTEFTTTAYAGILAAFWCGDMTAVPSSLADQATAWRKEYLTKYTGLSETVAEDLTSIVAAISGQLDSGSRVLLVPHSQGNLFANQVHRAINRPSLLSIMGVATPASKIEGITTPSAGDYVTASEDGVINLARITYGALPATLDAMTLEQFQQPDIDTHDFILFYLNPAYTARSAIIANIRSKLTALSTSTTSLPITLSWSDSSPLTLWVGDGGELQSALGINGTATYTVCNPQTFTFYFAWASSLGGWPTVATLSAGGKNATVNLAASNEFNLWGDMTRRLAGSVYVDQAGNVAGVQ